MAARKTRTKKTKRAATTRQRRFGVLALDGGGIRGVLTTVWLEALEQRLGSPLHQHFDLIAGTSTGAILACGIAAGMPAAELRQRYRELGREVFPATAGRLWSRLQRTFTAGPSAPKYDDDGLRSALRAQLGERRFGDLLAPTLVTAYDTQARAAVVFKTAGQTRPERWRWDDIPAWELVKASCSAPTYFPAHVLHHGYTRAPLIDGGVVANNPTACAIAEAMRQNRERPPRARVALDRFVIASFGTGEATRPISIEDAREWGALEWAAPIVGVLFDGAADAVHYIATQIAPGRYYRMQCRLETAFDDLDDASDTNIAALQRTAEQHLASPDGAHTLDQLVRALR